MVINCCDNCERIIKRSVEAYNLHHALTTIELCEECAEPMLRLLVNRKMIMPGLVRELMANPFVRPTEENKENDEI